MKNSILTIFLFATQILFNPVYAQDRIIIDLDQDNILDTIFLNYKTEQVAQLVCRLSSKGFEKETSQFIEASNHFTLYLEEDDIVFYNHKNHVERMATHLQYDSTTQDIVLVGMSRSQDGDNDINGAGRSYLDISSQSYSGEWSYYDYFDENPEEYRIYMPEIKTQMDFNKIKLSELNESTFTTYSIKCLQLYNDQLKSIFPNGNNSRDGYLMVDLNDDYGVDSVYFDHYDSRIKAEIYNYDTDDIEEITSEAIDFNDPDYEIIELAKGNYLLKSTSGNQEVNFGFNAIDNKFIVDDDVYKNWIHKDLDHDGIVDSVKVYWGEGDVYLSYQLSTQGFLEVRSPTYIAYAVVVSESKSGFQFELGFSRSGLTVSLRFDDNSKAMQVIGLDYWDMYNESEYSLNVLTTDFNGSRMEYEEESEQKFSFHSKLEFPLVDFDSFDDQVIMDFTERSMLKLDQAILQKQFKMDIEADNFGIGYFTVSPRKPFDLGDAAYLNCEFSVQIEDANGQLQQVFVDNIDLEGEIILLFDNRIKYSDDLGYYFVDDTSFLPRNLPEGKYKIRAILSHQDFFDDIIGDEIEIELPLKLE